MRTAALTGCLRRDRLETKCAFREKVAKRQNWRNVTGDGEKLKMKGNTVCLNRKWILQLSFRVPGARWLRKSCILIAQVDIRKQHEKLLLMTGKAVRLGAQEMALLRCKMASLASVRTGVCIYTKSWGWWFALQSQCWGDRDWRELGAHQPARQISELLSQGRGLVSKTQVEKDQSRHQTLVLCFTSSCMRLWTYVCIHACVHTKSWIML